jgi:hypothetical protein
VRSGDERRRNTQSGVAVGAVEVQLLSSSHVDDDRYRAARQRSAAVRDPAVPVSDDFGVVGQRGRRTVNARGVLRRIPLTRRVRSHPVDDSAARLSPAGAACHHTAPVTRMS